MCRASSCEHAPNARRMALMCVRTVGSERLSSAFIWRARMPLSSSRRTSSRRGVRPDSLPRVEETVFSEPQGTLRVFATTMAVQRARLSARRVSSSSRR